MRVLCFGDSNTYGFDPRGMFGGQYAPSDRWVNVLAEATGWKIINAGENGREIPVRQADLQRCLLMLSNQKPLDRLVVMLGLNDLLQGNDVTRVSERMAYFLSQIPMEPHRIVLIAPPAMVRGQWVPSDELITASKELGNAYEQVAKRCGTGFVHGTNWPIPMAYDGVHFTEDGHRMFAKLLEQELMK